jgi:ribose 5-phosphate isomerase A
MDLKEQAAGAAIPYLENKNSIGLGAGSTIRFITNILPEIFHHNTSVKIATSSWQTRQLLESRGFLVTPIDSLTGLDIYVDGCDQLDKHLNALKSGGGIHTIEKLFAEMAKEFILVGDEGKYIDAFDGKVPLVVEVLPDAAAYVSFRIRELYPGASTELRKSDLKEGPVITDQGNYLMNIRFSKWPSVSTINKRLKSITGILETSLFYNMAHKAILAGKEGIRLLEKNKG